MIFRLWLEENIAKTIWQDLYSTTNMPLAFFRDYYSTYISPEIKEFRAKGISDSDIINKIKNRLAHNGTLRRAGRYVWKLVKTSVTPFSFTSECRNNFFAKGSVIINHAERSARQERLARVTSVGENSPPFWILDSNGLFVVEEGWHRTTALLMTGFNGGSYEDSSNWSPVLVQAYVGKKN